MVAVTAAHCVNFDENTVRFFDGKTDAAFIKLPKQEDLEIVNSLYFDDDEIQHQRNYLKFPQLQLRYARDRVNSL
jgi:hypothetical protein